MNNSNHRPGTTGSPNILKRLFNQVLSRIAHIFEPEEVEVTFKVEGNKVKYTYTKVSH